MIRYFVFRGRPSTVVLGAVDAPTRVNNQMYTASATARKMPCSISSRSFSRSPGENSSHRRRSPSPRHGRETVTKVMSPNSSKVMSQRSYGTAPLTEIFMGGSTCDFPVRHTVYHSLHEATPFYNLRPVQPLQQTNREDYDEWNNRHGFVVMSVSSETAVSAPAVSTARVADATATLAVDVMSDDEELLPLFADSSAEQVLAMMDTSYYHASYQANGHEDDGDNDDGDKFGNN
jgi:hypothetical protein